ncbi:MAG: MMPL family transporter, partial [Planctomycetota bacterium]|nr:MMPL family transporter [Planctomycetota bacterium]
MAGFFKSLGRFVSRAWVFLLAAWVSAAIVLTYVAPKWKDVCQDGEFSFLPEDVPTFAAEKLFAESFPDDLLASSVIVVVHRPTQKDGLLEIDRDFIEDILKPRIERIAEEMGGLADLDEVDEEVSDSDATNNKESSIDSVVPPPPAPPPSKEGAATTPTEESVTPPAQTPPAGNVAEVPAGDTPAASGLEEPQRSIISRVRTYTDRALGNLLDSEDGIASLVLIELTTEFLEESNHYTIEKIENLVAVDGPLAKEKLIPPGLELSLSGVAVVGRDMIHAAAQSASATEQWTFILVVILLVIIYRSFGLALIPLLTVGFSVHISIKLLSLAAMWGWITPFHGMEIYISVVLYGAGVDYCLFLIARYIEELDRGERVESAIETTLDRVGAALVASAGTVTCGIGMMYFAEFGKFKQAGIGIAFSLVIVMLAALTFSPTLLRLFGRWVFWPFMRNERVSASGGDWLQPANPLKRIIIEHLNWGNWEHVGRLLLKAPGRIWVLCVALMIPFAVHGVRNFDHLSYGLLSELPTTAPSVTGTKAVQDY